MPVPLDAVSPFKQRLDESEQKLNDLLFEMIQDPSSASKEPYLSTAKTLLSLIDTLSANLPLKDPTKVEENLSLIEKATKKLINDWNDSKNDTSQSTTESISTTTGKSIFVLI